MSKAKKLFQVALPILVIAATVGLFSMGCDDTATTAGTDGGDMAMPKDGPKG